MATLGFQSLRPLSMHSFNTCTSRELTCWKLLNPWTTMVFARRSPISSSSRWPWTRQCDCLPTALGYRLTDAVSDRDLPQNLILHLRPHVQHQIRAYMERSHRLDPHMHGRRSRKACAVEFRICTDARTSGRDL